MLVMMLCCRPLPGPDPAPALPLPNCRTCSASCPAGCGTKSMCTPTMEPPTRPWCSSSSSRLRRRGRWGRPRQIAVQLGACLGVQHACAASYNYCLLAAGWRSCVLRTALDSTYVCGPFAQGLVDSGQCTVPGAIRPAGASALLASAAGGKPAAGPFQGIGGGSGRSLLQSVPAAIDAVGMTELFAPMAAAAAGAPAEPPAHPQLQQQHAQQAGSQEAAVGGSNAAGGGASRLLSAVGRGAVGGGGSIAPARQVSGQTAAAAAAVDSLLGELGAAGPQQRGSGSGAGGSGGSKQFEPRPWERAALAASARPCPPRAPPPPVNAGGEGLAGNIVGPAHLVAKHAERQRSRSCSAEPEGEQAQQAQQQPGQAVGAAEMETDQPADQGPTEREQQGAQPPAEQGQQQAGVVQKGSGASGGSREQTVAAYLGQLKAALSKVRGLFVLAPACVGCLPGRMGKCAAAAASGPT